MDNDAAYVYLPQGTKLNGRYIIERVIGQGGFGITYYARHEMLKHYYAIKEFYLSGFCNRNTRLHTVILQGMNDNVYDKYKKRFLEEAQTVVSLDHPNIVKVVDVFEENNTAYMVMPFIKGMSLQDMVEKNGGPLPYELTVNYIGQLSDAVRYIHSQHILHRDIKPDNVLVTSDNKVTLIDFGSAREFVNNEVQHHTSILTHGYAPPEQYNSTSKKGNFSDIYSIGGVFYYCLTGKIPVDATTRLLETSTTGKDPMESPKELNKNVSDDVNRTILKAMALNPEERHQTVEEFMNDMLGRVKSKKPTEKKKVEVKEKVKVVKEKVKVVKEKVKALIAKDLIKGISNKTLAIIAGAAVVLVVGILLITSAVKSSRLRAAMLAEDEAFTIIYDASGCRDYLTQYPEGRYVDTVNYMLAGYVADSIEVEKQKRYEAMRRKAFIDVTGVTFSYTLDGKNYIADGNFAEINASAIKNIAPTLNYSSIDTVSHNLILDLKTITPDGVTLSCWDSLLVDDGQGVMTSSFDARKDTLFDKFKEGTYVWQFWYEDNRIYETKLDLFEVYKTIKVKNVTFDMVKVVGGTFAMGCDSKNPDRCYSDERPVHNVTLDDYFIGRYEVTQELWLAVMGTKPSMSLYKKRCPVDNVNLYECHDFIEALNRLTGLTFRLPTEAEWEYAARGGVKRTDTEYAGSDNLSEVAWWKENSDYSRHTVGVKKPNELNIYDMTGNVGEWCEDKYYGAYPDESQYNPLWTKGSFNVVRGGSSIDDEDLCGLTRRTSESPYHKSSEVGLRLVLEMK